LTSRIRSYLAAHGLRTFFALVLMTTAAADTHVAVLVVCPLIATVCIYDRYPRNLVFGMSIVAATAAIRTVFAAPAVGVGEAAASQLSLLCAGSLIAGLGSQYIRRREELVEARKDVKRLDGTVISLSRANLQYQDFASEAEVSAMENERKRITRDIHDVVGYTLTNNIMMMEAATDMMLRNPFGVPSLIAAARENAQEGLASIRESLYALRSQTAPRATGLHALARMVRIYERATGVRVQTGFGTAAWNYEEAVDSAVYHMAQEGLMNAFRHGKASTVTLIVSERAEGLTVTVRDNGLGAAGYTEGIGLRGMRERLEKVGGTLVVDTAQGGFMIRGTIPLREIRRSNGNGDDGGPREDPPADR
jgi:signal transduction histidine kinase